MVTAGERTLDLDRLVVPGDIEHPSFPDDQDVFAPDDNGDCCGVLIDGGLCRF